MVAIAESESVVIFRKPENGGNFTYWMAEGSGTHVQVLVDRVGNQTEILPSEFALLGNPLNLSEVMLKLKSHRNFQVLDLPVAS